jgi:hypothetical protein
MPSDEQFFAGVADAMAEAHETLKEALGDDFPKYLAPWVRAIETGMRLSGMSAVETCIRTSTDLCKQGILSEAKALALQVAAYEIVMREVSTKEVADAE